jgi:predicted nucleic acid-binding protein
VLDTSTIINLLNGQAFDRVLTIPNSKFFVGALVLQECGLNATLKTAQEAGSLTLLDGHEIPAATFVTLLGRYELGDGETECLAACLHSTRTMASDDRRARLAGETELGKPRVIGSQRLLRLGVDTEVFDKSEAMQIYQEMISRGGYLMPCPPNYFD